METIDDMPHVMGEDGQFHAQDEAVDLSNTALEAWVALGFFWILGLTVFYQFFTRYVMNDSAAWTEEIARYLLIATVFTGATIGVVKNNHIQVDFFYRFMSRRLARAMATLADLLRIGFFAAAVVLTAMMMIRLGSNSRMTMVDLPMNWVYRKKSVFIYAAGATIKNRPTLHNATSCGIRQRWCVRVNAP